MDCDLESKVFVKILRLQRQQDVSRLEGFPYSIYFFICMGKHMKTLEEYKLALRQVEKPPQYQEFFILSFRRFL